MNTNMKYFPSNKDILENELQLLNCAKCNTTLNNFKLVKRNPEFVECKCKDSYYSSLYILLYISNEFFLDKDSHLNNFNIMDNDLNIIIASNFKSLAQSIQYFEKYKNIL